MADGSRRGGRRSGTEEERRWRGACQGRVRAAEGRWGRDAEEQGEDERLREEERKRERERSREGRIYVHIQPLLPQIVLIGGIHSSRF